MKHELSRNNNYDFFEEAMHDFFPAFYGYSDRRAQKYMRTDIKETDDAYRMEVELPGMDKKDIHIDLKDGYLSITANKSEKNEGDKKDNYIHRERSFSCSRSYYVGDIRKEDIKAKYENGILNVCIPKEVKQKDSRALRRDRITSLSRASGFAAAGGAARSNARGAPFARPSAARRAWRAKICGKIKQRLYIPQLLLYNKSV